MDMTIDSGLAAILGASVGAFAGLLGAAINNRHQRKLAQGEDRRRIRDAKRERVRGALTAMLAAAWVVNDALVDLHSANATFPPKESEIDVPWPEIRSTANRALLDLSIESDMKDVIQAYRELNNTFRNYLIQRDRHLSERGSSNRETSWPQELEERARGEVSELEKLLQGKLDALDTPI